MFGMKMKAEDVRMIVTVDSLKLIKFAEVLGKTDKDLYVYWLRHIDETGRVIEPWKRKVSRGKLPDPQYSPLDYR